QDLVDVLVHLLLRPSSDRRFTVAPTALPSREVWRATRPPSGEMWRAARPPRPLVSAALRNEGVTEEASPPPPTAAYVARSLAAGACTHTRTAGAPAAATNPSPARTPGTQTIVSSTVTSGHASRSARGTFASTSTSWSRLLPRPPAGRST